MESKKYQTLIYQIDGDFDQQIVENLTSISDISANFFFIGRNVHSKDGFIRSSILDNVKLIINTGLLYNNIIVIPRRTEKNTFNDNIVYLLWFCRDKSKMFFDKDIIREKHIWKDVEWGKRKKNYNPNGKDPGNVWIPTEDDGKANITSHKLLTDSEVLERCIKATSRPDDNVLLDISDFEIEGKLLTSENIVIKRRMGLKPIKVMQPVPLPREEKNPGRSHVYFKSSESMPEITDNSIDLMVTSPPYWDLKDYSKQGQIGLEPYEKYINRLSDVFKETYRVLKPNGSMWININIRTKLQKPVLIPHDISNICRSIGFKFKDMIIWHKSSGIPTSKNNISDHFEYFLWFTKSEQFVFNNEEISKITDYKNDGINFGFTWNINRKAGSVGKDYIHPAIYPTELIERIINLCTHRGGIVLDPFLGSGTTLIAAINRGRSCIGYELNEDYKTLIDYRLQMVNINPLEICFSISPDPTIDNKKIFRK